MRSMTGFGRAALERAGTRAIAEVRALNQRFFELKLNLPRGWGEYESEMRRMIQSVVSRGRVEVFIKCTVLQPPPVQLQVNDQLAALYVGALRRLGKRLNLAGAPGVEVIMHRPEIFHVIEEDADPRHGVRLGVATLARALRALEVERVREGRSLRRDFAARIRKLSTALPKIERLAAHTRSEAAANFQKRIRDLLDPVPINEKRLYEDAAAAANHGDITEEITRLRIHLDALRGLIGRAAPVGKSIEFLLQEVNREVNTMGA
ncbi:MAG: YicC family protein, partial [Candidatus Binataceae bacterium]